MTARSADELIADMEEESGLELPEDAETLVGEAFAIAVSSDIDIEAMVNNEDFSDLGVGVKVKGDPDAIEEVLDKIRPQTDDPELLQSKSSDDYVSFSPNEDYLDQLSEDGDLSGLDTYKDVVPESDKASSVFYLNVDAGDGWLVNVLGGSRRAARRDRECRAVHCARGLQLVRRQYVARVGEAHHELSGTSSGSSGCGTRRSRAVTGSLSLPAPPAAASRSPWPAGRRRSVPPAGLAVRAS